jgi:acetyl-CoA carboxylase carboxyl transferase subunit alpha
LWRDRRHAPEAAEALKLTAQDLLRLNVVDEVVKEPPGGAHRDHSQAAENLGTTLRKNLEGLLEHPIEQLLKKRYKKFRALGNFTEGKTNTSQGRSSV